MNSYDRLAYHLLDLEKTPVNLNESGGFVMKSSNSQ